MPDELDFVTERIDFTTSIAIHNVADAVKSFKDGQEGICELCGEYFSRVIEVEKKGETILSCGGCRDKYRLT